MNCILEIKTGSFNYGMPRPKRLFGQNIEKFGVYDREMKFNPIVMDFESV